VARSVESTDGMGPEPKFDKSRYWNPEASKLTWLAIDVISPRDIAHVGRDRSSVGDFDGGPDAEAPRHLALNLADLLIKHRDLCVPTT
jgi:hypothetical protein